MSQGVGTFVITEVRAFATRQTSHCRQVAVDSILGMTARTTFKQDYENSGSSSILRIAEKEITNDMMTSQGAALNEPLQDF